MKRLAVVVAAAGLVAVGLAGCGGSGSSSESSSAEPNSSAAPSSSAASSDAASPSPDSAAPVGLMDPTKLQVCAYIAFPPLEYFDDAGEPTGFDIEAARAVANLWGIEAVFTDIGFDGLIPALDAQRCDVVWSGMFLNDERQAKADASPYLNTGQGLLVAKGNPAGITSIDSLAGKRLAVAAGTTAVDTAEQISKDLEAKGLAPIEIQQYPTLVAEVGAVKSGKADAVLELDVALAEAVRTAPDDFELVAQVFPTDSALAVYSQKGSGLAASITEAWAALIADGSAAKLAEQYAIPVENLTAE